MPGKTINLINILFIILIFALNFAAFSGLKYVLLVYMLFVFSVAGRASFSQALPIVVSFFFLEGQGRILWNYHPLSRIALDIACGLMLVNSLLRTRRFNVREALPTGLLLLLCLHILWYVIELFNPNSVSALSAIAATKIYIFPFLIFILFQENKTCFSSAYIERLGNLVVGLSMLECALSLYQYYKGDSFLVGLSPYYARALKDVFIAKDFRPFGTTFLPGAISVYLFLATGFLYIRSAFKLRTVLGTILFILVMSQTLLVTQVRSAQLKFLFVSLTALAIIVATTSLPPIQKKFMALKVFLASGVIVFLGYLLTSANPLFELGGALDRWEKVSSYESMKAGRAGPEIAMVILKQRLTTFPIGLGPGVTGAASSVTKDLLDQDPIYNKDTFWGYDNLYLSLIVEFGYGAIFYTLLILCMPLLLLRRYWQELKARRFYSARITGIATSMIFVIILGNWLAIGLPYNPESFFFWLWVAIGLNAREEILANVSA